MKHGPARVAPFVLLLIVSGAALAANDVAPPADIIFVDPFFSRDGVVTNELISPPDSIVFVPPFLARDGNVVQEMLAPPNGIEIRSPFVDETGAVTNDMVAAPTNLKFRTPFISRTGIVLNENVSPPDDIETREPFIGRVGVLVGAPSVPEEVLLRRFSAAPNPFNPGTQLSFLLAAPSDVTIVIYDASGRRVRTLFQGRLEADLHVMRWDGTDENGLGVASGVYLFRVSAGAGSLTLKAALLK